MDKLSFFSEFSCTTATYYYPPSSPDLIGTPPSTAHVLNTSSHEPPSVTKHLIHPIDTPNSIGSLHFCRWARYPKNCKYISHGTTNKKVI